jgi:ATP-dependent Lhr-like helicase
LLARHGVITREAVAAEAFPGGFGLVYPVLKGMEEHGRIRRGYFVAGLGATQFAMPGALDLLRALRDAPDEVEVAVLAATDPANPYGAALKWPSRRSTQSTPSTQKDQAVAGSSGSARTSRTWDGADSSVGASDPRQRRLHGHPGARIVNFTFLPDAEPDRRTAVAVVATHRRRGRARLIEEIDGLPPPHHLMSLWLSEAGFVAGAMGFQATFRNAGGGR